MENVNYEALLYTILSEKPVSIDAALRKYDIQPYNEKKRARFTSEELATMYEDNLNGLSIKEIAAKYKVSRATIETAIYRFKKKMRLM